MINWKKVNTDGVTPERNKELLVLWNLVQGKIEPTLAKQSKWEMDMDGGVNYEVDADLCKGGDQHQFMSVLICFFCVDRVDIL